MSLKVLGKLGGLRLLSLSLMLAQNVLVVRFMALEDIGQYYLMVTVAYLGNATIFVGTDLYLQRQLAHLSSRAELNQAALYRYVASTAAVGGGVVLIAAALYFFGTAWPEWWLPSLVCTTLSVATYLSGLGRNLCQLAAHPAFSNLGPVTEGLFRSIALCGLAYLGQAHPLSVAAASAAGSLLAAAVTLGLLLRAMKRRNSEVSSYRGKTRLLGDTVVSIGTSGILNWAQLQGYRPLMMSMPNGGQVVGSVAFMSTLGSTAANAVFTILAQLQVPQQYNTRGASTPRYLRLLGFTALGLSLICLPAGAVFLWLSAKTQLMGLVYLVAVGVLVEAGNAAIGVCTHHMNALDQKMWGLPLAGFLGCALTFGMIIIPVSSDPHLRVAIALLAGQALAVSSILYLTYRTDRH
ncbi:hypothetical protein [Malikia sp.]|uniref:hypothetical protein n=1 Tax=Malikia sp. TaxID=2070706 RepID=UPI002625791F|nr:hypothetical protein [Malikia sp.]MDD2727796.1 hypothetical protein [Malikia sp.]